MKDRVYLERQIIGAALHQEGLALHIFDIIRPINFTDELCMHLALVINQMVQTDRQIDLPAVILSYNQKFNSSTYSKITEIADGFRGQNIKELCLILLQMDIREKSIAECKMKESLNAKDQNFELAKIWKECHDYLSDQRNDILMQLPTIANYINQYDPENSELIIELSQAIPKVAQRINNADRINRATNIFKSIANNSLDNKRKYIINQLCELIVITISGAKLPENMENMLSLITEKAHA